jgi:hypothetical protein
VLIVRGTIVVGRATLFDSGGGVDLLDSELGVLVILMMRADGLLAQELEFRYLRHFKVDGLVLPSFNV